MKQSSPRVSPATVFFALLALALGIALYLKSRPQPVPEAPVRAIPSPRPRTTPLRHISISPSRRPSPSAPAASSAEARVAIVIDDLGNDRAALARIAGWTFPVAGAVLPGLSGSAPAARDLESAGKEVLLHLPMEPRRYPQVRPGPGVVLLSQNDEEITRTVEADLESVPGAVGVNNHMGSAATADSRVMRAVTRVLARRGLFFVDSRTTGASVAREAAKDEGVRSVSRRVFLDDVATEEAVTRQIAELIANARREGFALAIGHPYPATLAVLERDLPKLGDRGVRLVAVGELVR